MVGRWMRGVVTPFPQVTVTGRVATLEASAECDTCTAHAETTVAVTISGAAADSACASAGALAMMAATTIVRTIPAEKHFMTTLDS